ncbi:hypothetical protein J4447_00700 [Candidatus Pacearchaeota archaeon]|nr:hypothetical protein [Candidatus Pacearchaeota archaeon]
MEIKKALALLFLAALSTREAGESGEIYSYHSRNAEVRNAEARKMLEAREEYDYLYGKRKEFLEKALLDGYLDDNEIKEYSRINKEYGESLANYSAAVEGFAETFSAGDRETILGFMKNPLERELESLSSREEMLK